MREVMKLAGFLAACCGLMLTSCSSKPGDDAPFLGTRVHRLVIENPQAHTDLANLLRAERLPAETNAVPALMNQDECNWMAIDLLDDLEPGQYLDVSTAAIDSMVLETTKPTPIPGPIAARPWFTHPA